MSRGALVLDKKLTKAQKKHIAKTILPSLESEQHEKLFQVIECAWSNHEVFSRAEANELVGKPLKDELEKLHLHLNKSLDIVMLLSKHEKFDELIDKYYYVANHSKLLMDMYASSRSGRSGMELMLQNLICAVQKTMERVPVNRGRAPAKEFAFLIGELYDFFVGQIPEHMPTSADDSPFTNLVNYVVSNICDGGIINAKRQIDFVLNNKTILQEPGTSTQSKNKKRK